MTGFTEQMKSINPYEPHMNVELCSSSQHTGGHQVEKNCFTVTYVCHCLFRTWPPLSSSSSSSASVLVATRGSLLQSHFHGCTVVVFFPFILIDGLLPSRRRKKPSVTGHDMASQLSIWLMCAAWIQATALVVEAPSHSPWIHITAHILLLLWCNCFVIAAQTWYNTVSI